jgi:uncharacterized protein YjbI with pentapeptide repeats
MDNSSPARNAENQNPIEKNSKGRDFSNRVLANKDFTGFEFQGANFFNADLSEADFSNAEIQGANFFEANLQGATFYKAKAGLTLPWQCLFYIIHILLCLTSTFTCTISIVFFIRFFRAYSDKLRRIPFENTALMAIFAFLIVVYLRTFVYNSWMNFSVELGIYAIIAVFILAVLRALITEDKKDVQNFALTGFFLSAILIILKTDLLHNYSVFGAWEKQLSLKISYRTLGDGKWMTMICASLIGGTFGSWFSKEAIKENGWFNWLWDLYVRAATLKGTIFTKANLTNATFELAVLSGANLREAIITRTNWKNTRFLENANVNNTYLRYPNVRAMIVYDNIRKQPKDKKFDGFNLQGINLESKNLSEASFVGTNLNEANLKNANLEYADLERTRLAGANLSRASLTGATLHDWITDKNTDLSDSQCNYVYLEKLSAKKENRRRQPATINFEAGEFAKLYSKHDIGAIELKIPRNFNRQAFRFALEESIQGIDYRLLELEIGKDEIAVKVKVPDGVDPDNIANRFYRAYKNKEAQTDRNGLQSRSSRQSDRRMSIYDIIEYDDRIEATIIYNDNRIVNLYGDGSLNVSDNRGEIHQ